jgi:hypothetical protein
MTKIGFLIKNLVWLCMLLTRVDVNYSDDLFFDVVSSNGPSGFVPSSSAEEALLSNYTTVDSSTPPHKENFPYFDPYLYDILRYSLFLNFTEG